MKRRWYVGLLSNDASATPEGCTLNGWALEVKLSRGLLHERWLFAWGPFETRKLARNEALRIRVRWIQNNSEWIHTAAGTTPCWVTP